ncbi:MAG: SDR family oxidoreductase [Clostridiales bacterium]|nr:SDR family oxidoreductase [Clostridiales bacterium]
MRLQDKVAIVTGAGAGMGKVTAELFAQEGCKVAVCDLNEETAKQTAKEISAAGGVANAYQVNISDEASVDRLMKAVIADFSKLDILVNCAGINGVNQWAHQVEEKDWDAVFAVDVKGTFFMTKHAVPLMKENGKGSIVNFCSIYGIIGANESAPYCAAKGAVANMTRTDAICYGKSGIRVNSVCPGTVLTELTLAKAREVEGGEQAYIDEMLPKHPIGFLGEPIDIAHVVLFLASDEARFVTGVNMPVDGGYTAR